MTTAIQGLSESEACARRSRGQGNDARIATSRSYVQILVQNTFTFINIVLFSIGAVLLLLGRPGDAVVTSGLVLMNTVIGVFQETRAKQTLDRIALLTRPQAAVIRDGVEKTVDPSEVVLGDILVCRAGDQIIVDGMIVGDGVIDADESLLTGESDLIPKRAGDEVFSGSFCVNGSALYEATRVGVESVANKLTAGARAFRQVKTPLQKDVELVIRLLVLIATSFGVMLALSSFLDDIPLVASVQMAAVIAGLVPNGLFFMVTIAYAMGAVRMAGSGALIQQANSIESMSSVNVLCLDKTGTLTANRINLHTIQAQQIDEAELRAILGDYAASTSAPNHTSDALKAACPGEKRHMLDEAPFSSARKWSAISFDDLARRGVYVLGAPEMLREHVALIDAQTAQIDEWAAQGLRVLIFAHSPDAMRLNDDAGQPHLPAELKLLGLLSFSDELRAEAQTTLQAFVQAGIKLKIISGDNPNTVAALARQAGFHDDIKIVSGLELAEMDDVRFAQAAAETTVFGRISPQQKEQLVRALKSRGHYVAMIGDGVNDVLSLKQAHIGIAMQSGSAATRSVADIVLLNDSFAALPPAFLEGQRILNGMQDVLRLFLTRASAMALIIIATAMLGAGFPFSPKDSSLVAFAAVGIPTFALAAWSRPGGMRRSLLYSIVHFVIPAAFLMAFFGLLVYLYYLIPTYQQVLTSPQATPQQIAAFLRTIGVPVEAAPENAFAVRIALETAQTALTSFFIFAGLVLVVFVEPPTPWWVGGDDLSGDWRPTYLAIGISIAYLVVLAVPGARGFFELAPVPASDLALIAGVTVIWALALRFAWRGQWLQRFLNIQLD